MHFIISYYLPIVIIKTYVDCKCMYVFGSVCMELNNCNFEMKWKTMKKENE